MNSGLEWYTRWSLMILLLSLATACLPRGQPAPQRDFTTESLLMDDSMFPPGWKNAGPVIPTADSHGAFEHVLMDITGPGGVAVHEIYRYEFVESAQREYKRQLDVWFPDTQYYDKWLPREDLNDNLAFADESYIACARRRLLSERAVTNCGMVARYHEYVVRFSTQVVPPHLTFEDLAEVLKSIDSRFASTMQAPQVESYSGGI